MSDVTWIRVSSPADLHRIAKAKVAGMNTYSASTDKTGAIIIPLGHDSKPDSDWGQYTRGNVIIRVTGGDDLLEEVEVAIRTRLGLPGGAVLFAKATEPQ